MGARSWGVVKQGFADVAQLVEHSLGKGEVTSSILVIGSMGLVGFNRREPGLGWLTAES